MTNTTPDQIEMDEQVLKDIVITAVEGGINYWAAVSGYDPDEGTVTVYDQEEEDETHDVDLDVIRAGISELIADKSLAPRFHQQAVEMVAGIEVDFDADTADVLLQIGLFDRVVYG